MKRLLMIAAAAGMAAGVPVLAGADGQPRGKARGHSVNPATCPPGLANRIPTCIPPGQARRLFREGQRVPLAFRDFTDFDDIPLDVRDRFELDDDERFIVRDRTIFVVDPVTRLVTRIIDLID